jgi:hypothetical protein
MHVSVCGLGRWVGERVYGGVSEQLGGELGLFGINLGVRGTVFCG